MEFQTIQVFRTSPWPLKRASAGASGYDLCAYIDGPLAVAPGARVRIGTGIHLSIPHGWEGQVRGRSGLAFRHGITVPTGTIDSDYRGDVGVILFNQGQTEFVVHPGDRIAQLVFACVSGDWDIGMVSVDELDDLGSTDRGAGGFGSTGVAS